MKQMQLENNKTVNCEEAGRRKDYFVQYQKEESQTTEIVEKCVLLAVGALLLMGKAKLKKGSVSHAPPLDSLAFLGKIKKSVKIKISKKYQLDCSPTL